MSIFHFKAITLLFSSKVFSALSCVSSYIVCSGILSVTSIAFNSLSELLVTVITYSIISPLAAIPAPVNILAVFIIFTSSSFASIFDEAAATLIAIGFQFT